MTQPQLELDLEDRPSRYQELRPRQEAALARIREAVRNGTKRLVAQAPTGFGKTRLGVALIEEELDQGGNVIFSVPALELIDQTVAMLQRNEVHDIGVIQRNHEMTNGLRRVQVASVQTLLKREAPPPSLMIVDEVHRWFKHYERLLKLWGDTTFVGLSATPWTKGLGKHFSELIVAGTVDDGIREGWLSEFRTFAPYTPDLRGIKTVAGDYHLTGLSGLMDKAPLTADIVETWLTYGQGRPTFVFAVDRAHAKHLCDRFNQKGVTAAYMDAFTPREERDAIRLSFEAEEIEVVCNVGVLTVGVDWDVRCIVLARPTKSEMLYVQMVGRGLRPTPEGKHAKDHLLILDHTGTTQTLGFVSDIHHPELNDGKHKESKPKLNLRLPKPCPACSFLKPAGIHVCPACGFAPSTQNKRIEAPGELRFLDRKPKPAVSEEEQKRWYAGLQFIGLQRGYKPGWSAVNFKEKFGDWPPKHWNVAARAPAGDIRGWVLHKQIKYAKSHRNQVLT